MEFRRSLCRSEKINNSENREQEQLRIYFQCYIINESSLDDPQSPKLSGKNLNKFLEDSHFEWDPPRPRQEPSK